MECFWRSNGVAREQCDFSGISHSYILWNFPLKSHLLQLSAKLSPSAPSRSCAACHAAVDHQFRARHVAGRIRGEEQHTVRDILRLPGPSERYPVLATSFGSIGTLLPTDTGSFVQIGVSMTPG